MAKSTQHRVFVLKPVFTLLGLLGQRLQAAGSCWDVKGASGFTRWSLTERRRRWAEDSWDCIIFYCQIRLKSQFWQITPSFNLIPPCKCLFSFKYYTWMYMYSFGVQWLSIFSKWTADRITHACLWNTHDHKELCLWTVSGWTDLASQELLGLMGFIWISVHFIRNHWHFKHTCTLL